MMVVFVSRFLEYHYEIFSNALAQWVFTTTDICKNIWHYRETL